VAAFQQKYGRIPTLYASQGYDAARLIGSALAATEGGLAEMGPFRDALREADFQSVRGNFRFGSNQHPVQDIYVREVVASDDVGTTNRTVAKVFRDHADAYAKDCEL
jgi:branched-chain amino acid transport system substrate-binding protein